MRAHVKPAGERSKGPVKLDKVIAHLQEPPDQVQHWNVDEAGLDDLVARLSTKPGIHAVHVSADDKASVPAADRSAGIAEPSHREGKSMKLLPVLLSLSMGIVIAVPAHADPGIDEAPSNDNNGVFLSDLQKVGITYGDPNQAISAGQAVCACIHNGMSGLHLLKHLQENNPSLTEIGAAQLRRSRQNRTARDNSTSP